MPPAATLLPGVLADLAHVSADECYSWPGRIDRYGYGVYKSHAHRRTFGAHRFVYMLLRGSIAPGMQLDHVCHSRDKSCPGGPTCQHRRCVNPTHLEQVTIQQNQQRRLGTDATCKRGHPRSVANTYRQPDGRRICRPCNAISVAAYKRRKTLAVAR